MNPGPKAPVALFVFNRYRQLPETLECLRQNNIDTLYIFCDGSRGSQDDIAVEQVRKLVRAIDWIKPVIVEHPQNLGLSESINSGLDSIFTAHDRVIVVEDDICVAPEFYGYMTQTLEAYKNDERIAGITGLRYPFDSAALRRSTNSIFIAPRFSSWGWGTWKRFWTQRETDRTRLAEGVYKTGLALDRGGSDMQASFQGYFNGSLGGSWDVACAANMLVNNQCFIWPQWNMVRNTGLTEGTHAGSEAPSWKLEWETAPSRLNLPTNLAINDTISREFLAFFKQSEGAPSMSKIRKVGGKIKRRLMPPAPVVKPDPSEYTTTDGPMEVPVQKEAYFIALNQYVSEGDKVLDVGCGIGYGLNLLAIKAKEVSGVDIDEKAIKYCKLVLTGRNPKLKELKVYDGYHLPYKDNEFDVITSVDVLEHVEDYDAFIDELMRVAKKAVILSTPNRRPEYTNPDGTPMNHWHLREWSREELDKIIKAHPVKVEWHHVNGPWEGPLTTSTVVKADTMTLTPALLPKAKK